MKKIIRTALFAFLAVVLLVALSNSTESPDSEPTTQPTATAAPAATAEAFTVEHDEAYDKTQEYIYKFLTEKGFEVQTIVGVPNIGRYEDSDPDDNSVGWYAYIKHNGKWKEFVVMLYNGEVSTVLPKQ